MATPVERRGKQAATLANVQQDAGLDVRGVPTIGYDRPGRVGVNIDEEDAALKSAHENARTVRQQPRIAARTVELLDGTAGAGNAVEGTALQREEDDRLVIAPMGEERVDPVFVHQRQRAATGHRNLHQRVLGNIAEHEPLAIGREAGEETVFGAGHHAEIGLAQPADEDRARSIDGAGEGERGSVG